MRKQNLFYLNVPCRHNQHDLRLFMKDNLLHCIAKFTEIQVFITTIKPPDINKSLKLPQQANSYMYLSFSIWHCAQPTYWKLELPFALAGKDMEQCVLRVYVPIVWVNMSGRERLTCYVHYVPLFVQTLFFNTRQKTKIHLEYIFLNLYSRKQQPAAIVEQPHRRTFPQTARMTSNVQEQRHDTVGKRFGISALLSLWKYFILFKDFIPKKSSVSICEC